MLVAGNSQAKAVVRVVAVDEDGQVQFSILPGSLERNRHLIGRAVSKAAASYLERVEQLSLVEASE
jgi:hypothetical protein